MPNFIDQLTMQAGNTLPGAAIGTGLGLLFQGANDRRQLRQQQKLQDMQIQGNMQMMDYSMAKQLQMWKDTSYGAQKDQMNQAGINPALMYGMGGAGGQSTGNAQGSVTGGQAPGGGGEIGMGLQNAAQLALMDAQRKNIEADTANKERDTLVKWETQDKLAYENVINELLANRDLEGNMIEGPENDHKRAGFQQKSSEIKKTQAETAFKIDENTRQELMNNAQLHKIAADISLMAKQGNNVEQITSNLEKEGKLKEMELVWAEKGLTRESFTKFIQLLILKLIK